MLPYVDVLHVTSVQVRSVLPFVFTYSHRAFCMPLERGKLGIFKVTLFVLWVLN
jgi:hypothetical protein